MTGFGDATAEHEGVRFSVELRSVNNRFFKCTVRGSDWLMALEPLFESQLRKGVHRGSLPLTISCEEPGSSSAHRVDADVARAYVEQVRGVAGMESASIDPASLLHLPGVLRAPSSGTDRLDRARAALPPLIAAALEHCIQMRTREGVALRDDIASHLDLIEDRLGEIAKLAPGVSSEYQRRLKTRLEAMLAEYDVQAQAPDIIREVAVFAEKTDIAEEIARLGEHVAHFRELLDSTDPRPVGRTLDFLSQELLREANTIASKSPDAAMSKLAVDIKGAIDRIKEQAANAE